MMDFAIFILKIDLFISYYLCCKNNDKLIYRICNHFRWSKRINVWAYPHLTFIIFRFSGNWITSLGIKVYPLELSSFCSRPSCPYLPRPTIKTFSPSTTKAVCPPPQLILLTFSFKLTSLRGTNWSDLSPWPNCP